MARRLSIAASAIIYRRARFDLDAALVSARLLPGPAHESACRAAFRVFLSETRDCRRSVLKLS